MKQILMTILALVMCLSCLAGCATPEPPPDEPDDSQDEPNQVPDSTPDIDTPNDEPEVDMKQQQWNDLALCITEGSVPLDKASIESRFADYAALGLRSVRLDLYWQNVGGKAVLQDPSKYQFEAAKKNGLLIKAIINPGGMTHPDPDSKLMDADGR